MSTHFPSFTPSPLHSFLFQEHTIVPSSHLHHRPHMLPLRLFTSTTFHLPSILNIDLRSTSPPFTYLRLPDPNLDPDRSPSNQSSTGYTFEFPSSSFPVLLIPILQVLLPSFLPFPFLRVHLPSLLALLRNPFLLLPFLLLSVWK